MRLDQEDLITLAFCASLSTSEYVVPREYTVAFGQTMKVFRAMFGIDK